MYSEIILRRCGKNGFAKMFVVGTLGEIMNEMNDRWLPVKEPCLIGDSL